MTDRPSENADPVDPDGSTLTPEHLALREALGEHALGLLSSEEAAQVEAHLAGCAGCRAELESISGLGALLRGIDPDLLERSPATELPEDLTDDTQAIIEARLAGATTGPVTADDTTSAPVPSAQPPTPPSAPTSLESRRRSRLPALLAAAAALLVLGGVGGWLLAPRPPDVPFEPVSVAVASPADDLDVSAGVIPHTWGVEVRMTATGFTTGEHYVVQVLDESGTRRDAGEFVGTGSKPMVCNLNSSVLRADATGFVVLDDTGATVVTSQFAPA